MNPRERIMVISFIEKTMNRKKLLKEIGVTVKDNNRNKNNKNKMEEER